MAISVSKLWTVVPAGLTGFTLALAGCSDATTREDVADARDELREERRELADARQEAREDVGEAREEAREHVVGKPVVSDDVAEARQDFAEARQEAAEEVAQEREDVHAAAADLQTEQQRLAATQ